MVVWDGGRKWRGGEEREGSRHAFRRNTWVRMRGGGVLHVCECIMKCVLIGKQAENKCLSGQK